MQSRLESWSRVKENLINSEKTFSSFIMSVLLLLLLMLMLLLMLLLLLLL